MESLSYSPKNNMFSDGTEIEWYIWMDIEDARFWNNREIRDPEIYLQTPFFGKFNSTIKKKSMYISVVL